MPATWHIAHQAGCCFGDVDALIDDATGDIICTRCPQCGEERPYTPPEYYYGPQDT